MDKMVKIKNIGKRGIEDALLFMWGLGILFLFMLALLILSFFTGSYKEELSGLGIVNAKVNLINYARSDVDVDGREMQELLIGSYYSGDYNELDEKTKDIFNKLYPKGNCLTWNIHYILQPDGKEVHKIVNLERPGTFDVVNWRYNPNEISRSSLLIPLVFEDKSIEVRFTETC